MPRKTYTPGFKLPAIRMVSDQGLSVAEAARRLGLHENLIRAWKKAAPRRGNEAVPGRDHPPTAEDELRRLRAEVARLKAGRDLLKKAAASFARPPS